MVQRYACLSLFVFLFLVLSVSSEAQLQVRGKVETDTKGPVPFASVLLLNRSDSVMVKGQVADTDGHFIINVSDPGNYFLSVSSIGYQPVSTLAFQLHESNSPYDVGTLISNEGIEELGEVVVQAHRPFFEQKIDRTVINVQSNITAAGGTALDVLQRSPGVMVDRMNNAISLSGKQGVRIMINGKLTRLPMDAVVQMLGGMNSENIERIELITTPPSKYDAEGDAGMINIVLLKTDDAGTNGNFSVFTGYGRRGKFGGSLNVNHRTKKLNIYVDYSFRNNYTRQFWNSDRIVQTNGEAVQTENQNVRDALTGIHNAKVGFDWNIGYKTSISGLVSMFDRRWDMDAITDISVSRSINPSYSIVMNTIEKNDWIFLLGSLNMTHQFNEHSSLSMDVDNIDYTADNPTRYLQDFYDDLSAFTGTEQLRSKKQTPIRTWVGKIDYSGRINENVTIETGAKASFSKLKNDITVDNLVNGIWEPDTQLTSDADMHEDIAAGYVSTAIKASPKLDVQLGLRYEHTITNIDTRAQQNVVDRNFGGWFPSVFVNKKINENNSWVVSYSRRVTRPSFNDIAPFVIFNDPNSFFSGNVSLLPSFTDAFKAEYRLKSVLLSLQYSHDKNAISLFQPKIDSDNKQVSSAENLDYKDNYSATLSFPIQVTGWWEMQVNIIGNYSTISASFLDNPFTFSIANYSLNGSNKITLSKKYTMEVSAFYQSKQPFGISDFLPFGALNFGLEKKFPNGNLRISYTDLLKTNVWTWNTRVASENLNTQNKIDFENSVASITYTMNFGNRNLKNKKRAKTGSEEEQRRFQN